jgi:hypothetical protein
MILVLAIYCAIQQYGVQLHNNNNAYNNILVGSIILQYSSVLYLNGHVTQKSPESSQIGTDFPSFQNSISCIDPFQPYSPRGSASAPITPRSTRAFSPFQTLAALLGGRIRHS